MPHVSRHAPIKTVSDKTLDLFFDCVTNKWSESERKAFFNDLLTPTERIMFSKRLGVIYLLVKGYSFDDIQEMLRVSPSTIARLWKGVQKGQYSQIVLRIKKPKKKDTLSWFSLIMPPMHMSKQQYKERMRRLGL